MSQPSKKQKTIHEDNNQVNSPKQNKENKKQNFKQSKHAKVAEAAQKALAIQKAALNQTRHQEEEEPYTIEIQNLSIKPQKKSQKRTQSTGENDLNFLQNVFGSQQNEVLKPSQLFHSTSQEQLPQQKLTQIKSRSTTQEKPEQKPPIIKQTPKSTKMEEEKINLSEKLQQKGNKQLPDSKKILQGEQKLKKQRHEQSRSKVKTVEQTEKVQQKDEPQHEIYVRGLNYDATEDDIKQFFIDCGEVTGVKLIKSTSGKSKGLAFIKFAKEESITTAESLNGTEHMGKYLQIEKTLSRQTKIHASASEKRTVFVGNLSFSANEDSLKNFFAKCGGIKDVTIPRTAKGEHRGFGYVEFLNTVGATKAILLSTNDLFGRQIRVEIATDRNDREIVQDTPRRGKVGFKRGTRGSGSSFRQGRSFLTSTRSNSNNRGDGQKFRVKSRGRS